MYSTPLSNVLNHVCVQRYLTLDSIVKHSVNIHSKSLHVRAILFSPFVRTKTGSFSTSARADRRWMLTNYSFRVVDSKSNSEK